MGRRLRLNSVPLFRKIPAFLASLPYPEDGAIGVTRMTSDVRDLYHVALRSAFSPQKPMSIPPSSSRVRSGLSDVAGFVVVKNRPPIPLCVGVSPVPCEMPPTRFVPLNVTDVR